MLLLTPLPLSTNTVLLGPPLTGLTPPLNHPSFTQCFWSFLAFWVLHRLGLLRVPLESEAMGLDVAHMGAHHGVGMSALADTKVMHMAVSLVGDYSRFSIQSPSPALKDGRRLLLTPFDLILQSPAQSAELYKVPMSMMMKKPAALPAPTPGGSRAEAQVNGPIMLDSAAVHLQPRDYLRGGTANGAGMVILSGSATTQSERQSNSSSPALPV